MTLQDSFVLAWRTVKSNKLRTGITVAIIAFGIMALIGIITAISAMNQSLKENFSFMGGFLFVGLIIVLIFIFTKIYLNEYAKTIHAAIFSCFYVIFLCFCLSFDAYHVRPLLNTPM